MANTTFTLSYLNEDDKAYGLAGMAISLAALNAMDRVAYVDLDSDGPMVFFSNSYYFPATTSTSPKATWDILLRNFHITSAMVLSNVMARSLVRLGEEVPSDALNSIFELMKEEGMETCALEEDEVRALYDRTLNYTRRIFGNPRLHSSVDEFARHISRRRTLSGLEILEELNMLQII